MKQETCRIGLMVAALSTGIAARPAMCQVSVAAAPGQNAVISATGTVTSSSKHTVTVRSENGYYVVYLFDHYTRKPATLPAGTMVTVVSTPTDEPGLRVATDILLYTPPVGGQPGTPSAPPSQPASSESSTGSASRSTHPYDTGEAVPVNVRKLEADIEKQSRKFAFGFRAGVGVDPEVMLIGVQARIGPFFDRNFSLRPNIDFGFGEVTKMFALDLNGVYRLPFNARQSKWSMIVGAGPALQFQHRNFEEAAAGQGIDFGEFKYQTGLNVLAGVEFRGGFFVEGKTTVWAGPHLRIMFGYTF